MTNLISGNIWKLIDNEYQDRDLAIIETNKLPLHIESKNEIEIEIILIFYITRKFRIQPLLVLQKEEVIEPMIFCCANLY